MSDQKRRWARGDALAVANDICARMAPGVDRIEVAGSVRRLKADVGDVEILFIPRFIDRAKDMFAMERVNLADEVIREMLADGTIEKRPCVGIQNSCFHRLCRHRLATGIFHQKAQAQLVSPLDEDTKPPCCARCGEYLKPDRVPTGDLCDLCGLCYDDVRNGR